VTYDAAQSRQQVISAQPFLSLGLRRTGLTCKCTHVPACRHDHHTKQVPGWTVTCHQPGTVTWTTPGHRSRTTTRAEYLG
jgi:hypothetical protein